MLVNCYALAVPETSGERWIQRVAVGRAKRISVPRRRLGREEVEQKAAGQAHGGALLLTVPKFLSH
jgi:hypothetical protein